MQKYHDEPKQYKGYLKSALKEPGWRFAGEDEASGTSSEVHVVLNWTEELTPLVPTN